MLVSFFSDCYMLESKSRPFTYAFKGSGKDSIVPSSRSNFIIFQHTSVTYAKLLNVLNDSWTSPKQYIIHYYNYVFHLFYSIYCQGILKCTIIYMTVVFKCIQCHMYVILNPPLYSLYHTSFIVYTHDNTLHLINSGVNVQH